MNHPFDGHETEGHNSGVSAAGPAGESADVFASLQALEQVGIAIRGLRTTADTAPLDPALLEDDVIGHADLAAALREFVELWEQRLSELADGASAMGAHLHQVRRLYDDTDAATAGEIASLDPDNPTSRTL